MITDTQPAWGVEAEPTAETAHIHAAENDGVVTL